MHDELETEGFLLDSDLDEEETAEDTEAEIPEDEEDDDEDVDPLNPEGDPEEE